MELTIPQNTLIFIGAITGFILVLLAITCRTLYKKLQKAKQSFKEEALEEMTAHNIAIDSLKAKLKTKSERVLFLEEKYKAVIDADAAAITVANNAQSDAAELLSDAEEYKSHQQDLIDKLVSHADAQLQQSRQVRKEARELFEHAQISAIHRSEKIIATAKKEAEAIAEEAFAIKGKEKELTQAIVAMQNVISGYKDDYIIPNTTVLDELADDYAFSEPGRKLKELRTEVRRLVKNNMAGTCDYADENRKQNAIHFVVDAFNGKVDSTLAKVKHDNFGILKQEIKDAFSLVNYNGTSFRNARITDTFLQVRLEELKWAVATHEIKQIELQEQREHKERIREENKAKKEYEAALKRAEREEKLIEEAIKQATEQLAKANADERALFESNIIELQQKLTEAEAASQRALSMAQQTKRGHVYVISNIGSFGERVYKIGMTRRLDPNDRVKELGDASVPFSFDIHAMIYSEDAPALESHLHRVFNDNRVNKINTRKEFFNTSISDIKSAIEQADIKEVHWTIKAEAEEYYESLQLLKQSKAS